MEEWLISGSGNKYYTNTSGVDRKLVLSIDQNLREQIEILKAQEIILREENKILLDGINQYIHENSKLVDEMKQLKERAISFFG